MSEHGFRKVDLGLILTVLTLCGLLYAIVKEPEKWDQAVVDVAVLKPQVQILQQKVIEIDSTNKAQMTLIIRELDGIHKDVRLKKGGD